MAYYLGVDTSNYTTSVAIMNEAGEIISDCRKVLDVKLGDRGLRQSEAVFQHINNFPEVFLQAIEGLNLECVKAIAVSIKPRPLENSYMPVFQAGYNYARIIGGILGKPVIETTHQEGHILAGIWSSSFKLIDKFLVLHISGGTTELLQVTLIQRTPIVFFIEKIGGSSDLHAGQFIDRIGVKMGLDFPCGSRLEQIAQNSQNPIPIPVAIKNMDISFSGPETYAQRLLEKGSNPAEVARGVENCLYKSFAKLILRGYAKTKLNNCLIVGGVACNLYIKKMLKGTIARQENINLFFANPQYSSDNAVGISYIAKTSINV